MSDQKGDTVNRRELQTVAFEDRILELALLIEQHGGVRVRINGNTRQQASEAAALEAAADLVGAPCEVLTVFGHRDGDFLLGHIIGHTPGSRIVKVVPLELRTYLMEAQRRARVRQAAEHDKTAKRRKALAETA